MCKVLIISRDFPPSGGAGVQRMTKLVKYLPKFGWRPSVICQLPQSDLPRDHTLLSDISDGVIVNRIEAPSFTSLKRHKLGRAILRLFLIPDPSIQWARKALRVAEQLITRDGIDTVITTDPASTHWIGYKLKKNNNIRWIMDIRDLWTLSFLYRPVSFLHGLIDRNLEIKMMKASDGIVCATSGFIEVFQENYPSLSKDRFIEIPNGYDEDDFQDQGSNDDGFFRLTYVGSLYDFSIYPRPQGVLRVFEPFIRGGKPIMVRSPAQILDAVSQLIDAEPDIAETLRIRFVGKFPQEYERMLEDIGLVEILRVDGYLNHRQAVAAMIESDLLFLMQAGEGSECFIPGKLYEYIRSGTPIIGLFLEGLAPALIRESGCGVVIAPGDVESIRTHIRNFHFAWKQGRSLINPKDTFIKQFTREKQSMAYSDWLTSIRRLQH